MDAAVPFFDSTWLSCEGSRGGSEPAKSVVPEISWACPSPEPTPW